MYSIRAIAFVVLTSFVSSFGLPWLGDRHEFNDDPHWTVALGRDGAACARINASAEADDDHCLVCHLQRTLRTASRQSQVALNHGLRSVTSPVASDPRTRAAIARPQGARGPPSSLL